MQQGLLRLTAATHHRHPPPLRRKGAEFKKVAALVGMSIDQVKATPTGWRLVAGSEVEERHARLAASLALCELMEEQDVGATVAKYGKLSRQGRLK